MKFMDPDFAKMNDHDLLVSMYGVLSRAISDLKDLNNKVTEFNNNYAKKNEVETVEKDHEARLRRLELWGAIAIGFMYAVEAYLNLVK